MNVLIGAVSVGAIGVAVILVGMFSTLTRHNSAARRADELQATDPRLADELRHVQLGIDRGNGRRVF